ncbi:hypothetical protein BV25DRAFT_1349050 [Artomyces pyxidatus]|uniref:Uncharacterized protein n=1 Tax=Artomyces pyxidatus TaxID=48021 RepID=A0ACB8SMM7_9AGAM|nr:hypothetical protein BV25DRAFT_1349050 [Artomyces pyxidatus]
MASKPPSISPESAGANALAQYPPTISLSNKLLSSALTLPPNPAFAYAVFSPTSPSPLQVDTVELARRQVLKLKKPSVLDSVLCSVLVDKDVQHLYVFTIDSGSAIEASRATLESMQFDGLSLTQSSTFTPVELYPCSPTCSTQRCPCPTCLNPSSFPPMLTYPTDPIHHCASFIPREPLRIPHAQLLQAVRDRLTEDICSASRNDTPLLIGALAGNTTRRIVR